MEGQESGFLKEIGERADLNQYWYSQRTIEAFVEEIVDCGGSAALVSTPSVFFCLPAATRSRSKVLDFDRQWEADPGFVFYDFNAPADLPADVLHTFDFVLVDPPFITEEVWVKYAQTTKLLLREGGRVLCTTIAENASMMEDLLGIRPVLFRPSIPNLVYQYSVYTNYTSDRLGKLNPEIDDADWRQTTASTRSGRGNEEAPIQAGRAPAEASEGLENASAADAPEAPLPPSVALLIELRDLLNSLKKATEALRLPVQQAVRRRAAEGEAAKKASASAETVLTAAEAATGHVQTWLAAHAGDAAVFGEFVAGPDPWKVEAVSGMIASARGEGLPNMDAYNAWALQAKQHSAALFRLTGSMLDRVKALKKEAALEARAAAAAAA